MKQIEKLENEYRSLLSGFGGPPIGEIINKINEVIDVLNGEQKECVSDAGKTSGVLVWRKIKTGERLPCDAFICINGNYCCYMPNAKGVCVGGDGYYLPKTDLEKLPKEGEKFETQESEDERTSIYCVEPTENGKPIEIPKERKDFKKLYEDALGWMRELYPGLHGATKEDAEHYFPQLRESEDERIRKELVEKISNLACGCFISQEQKQRFINYLEKPKEQKPAESSTNLDEILDDYFANFKVPEHQIIFEDTYRKIATDFYNYGRNAK